MTCRFDYLLSDEDLGKDCSRDCEEDFRECVILCGGISSCISNCNRDDVTCKDSKLQKLCCITRVLSINRLILRILRLSMWFWLPCWLLGQLFQSILRAVIFGFKYSVTKKYSSSDVRNWRSQLELEF